MTTENSRADALTDLLPCPFCGGTDVFVERLDYTACFVQCDSSVNPGEVCGMRGPIGIQNSDDEEIPGRGAAIREWSRRATFPAEQPAAAPIDVEPSGWQFRDLVEGEWTKWRHAGSAIRERYKDWPDVQFRPLYLPPAAAPIQEPTIPAELHHDTAKLVRRFARALANKLLAAQRKYGYSDNWMRDGWADECRAELMRHIQKGDPRDVAAYCAFLWHHNESTAPTQPAPAPSPADAPIAYDGLTEEFADEVARLANDAPGIREAVAGALESCKAIIAPQGNTAPSPADERAAFEAWLKRPHPNNWNDCNHPLKVGERQAARFGWQAGIAYARAASANETGAEDADALAHEVWSAAQRAPGEGIEDAVQRIAAILSRSHTAAAEAAIVGAWIAEDDRAITAAQKQRALDEGGATASAVRPYSIPCYVAAPQPAQADARDEDAYVAKRMAETLATVYATIVGDDQVDENDGLNAIQRCERAAQVLRLEVELYRGQADARVGLTDEQRTAIKAGAVALRKLGGFDCLADNLDGMLVKTALSQAPATRSAAAPNVGEGSAAEAYASCAGSLTSPSADERAAFNAAMADECPEFQHPTYTADDVYLNVRAVARSMWLAGIAYARAASANETGAEGALGYAQRLATGLWEKHWRDSAPQWKVLDDTLGVLTQIDNMVCGLSRSPAMAGRNEKDADQ